MDKGVKDLSIDTGSSVAGAATGLVIAGPPGAVLGSIVSPVASNLLKRFLTRREKSRIQKIVQLATQKFQDIIKEGAGLRSDLDKNQFQQLTEGILLKAKDTYEEKKIPLIANLLAATPFTNTPMVNLNQTLIYADQLSFRQLCLIAIIGQNEWEGKLNLSKEPLIKQDRKKHLDEKVEGIYSDLNHLLVLGLIGQVFSEDTGPAIASGMYLISPASLKLLYPGRLLNNGMLLETIETPELEPIIEVLKQEERPPTDGTKYQTELVKF